MKLWQFMTTAELAVKRRQKARALTVPIQGKPQAFTGAWPTSGNLQSRLGRLLLAVNSIGRCNT
jgi:hypothetical protein